MQQRFFLVPAACLLIAFVTLASPPAGDTRALIDGAKESLAKKDFVHAIRALESALALVREAAPLVIEQAVVVDKPPEGLGVYTPAAGARVRDRQIWLYVEVANFGKRAIDAESWQVDLSVSGDFALEDGSSIGTMSLGRHTYQTRGAHGVTFFGPNMKLSEKAPPGVYFIDLTVVDEVTRKQAKKKLRFVIPT